MSAASNNRESMPGGDCAGPANDRACGSAGVRRRGFIVIRGIMPRSGTNFLADLLRLHPALVVNPGEFWEFAPLRFTPLWTRYVNAIAACKHAPAFEPSRLEAHVGRAWVDYLGESVSGAATHLVVKEPSVAFLHGQYGMFPDSRTIIVVRDARDLIESALRSGFVLPRLQWWRPRHWRRLLPLGDFRALCRMYADAGAQLLSFLAVRADLVERRQVQVVRYEDILADPARWVRQLLFGAGVSAEEYDWPALESVPVRGSSFLRGDAGEMDFSHPQPKTSAFQPVGRWSGWSSARRRVFEREAGAAMRRLGYDWNWDSPNTAPMVAAPDAACVRSAATAGAAHE